MVKNITSPSNFTVDAENYNSSGGFYFWISIVVAILSPVAVVGNSLVLAAIWRNSSLRTPSYVLLAGLAFTDFCTGLITQPFYVASTNLFSLVGPDVHLSDITSRPTFYLVIRRVNDSFGNYFFILTMMTITVMSIERWLHMSHRSLMTVRRTYVVVAGLLLLPIPLVVYRVLYVDDISVGVASISLLSFCLTATSFAYFRVFRIIRCHRQQVQPYNAAQPAIDFAKYKKSVFTIFYILGIFYIGYLPMAITMGLTVLFRFNAWSMAVLNVSVVLACLSSSLNPLLYLWRMKDIRSEVARLVKRILCKGNY